MEYETKLTVKTVMREIMAVRFKNLLCIGPRPQLRTKLIKPDLPVMSKKRDGSGAGACEAFNGEIVRLNAFEPGIGVQSYVCICTGGAHLRVE